MALMTDYFASVGIVPGGSNNTVEATPGTGAPEILTAAGAGDNTEVIGNTINRQTYGMPQSALVCLQAFVNLADTETLSLAVEVQESSDGSTWDAAEVIEAATIVKTADGAFTDLHTESYVINLGDRKQYFRVNVTPDLSAASTDVAVVQWSVVLGGAWDPQLLPAHQAADS